MDGELEVLHVCEGVLKLPGCDYQFLPNCWQNGSQFVVSMSAASSRHHVFTLRIEQKVHPQRRFAAGRVACEPHAGTRLPAGITKDHALYGYCCSNRIGYAVQASILACLGALPRCKNGLDRTGELQTWFLRKPFAPSFCIDIEKPKCERPQISKIEVTFIARTEQCCRGLVEELPRQSGHNLAVGGHESSIRIPDQPRIAGLAQQAADSRIAEPNI